MCAMMKDMDCPMTLWGEAVSTVAYCINQTSTSSNGGIMPIQAFNGIVPDVSHMRVFYSDAYIHRSKSGGAKKLGDQARLVKFIGYPDGVSAYEFYDPATCTVILSCSPRFLESTYPKLDPAPSNPDLINDLLDDDEISIASDEPHDSTPSQ